MNIGYPSSLKTCQNFTTSIGFLKFLQHQSTSLAESQKAVEAHGSKFWVTNLSIVPHTLGTLTTNAI